MSVIKKIFFISILNMGGVFIASDINSRPRLRQDNAFADHEERAANLQQNDQLTCWDLVKAGAATCCFPCLLLFSGVIINQNFTSHKIK